MGNKHKPYGVLVAVLILFSVLTVAQDTELPKPSDGRSEPMDSILPPLPPIAEDPVIVPFDEKIVPKRKVVIIRDSESWYFDQFAENVKTELKALSLDSYNLEFEDYDAKGDSAKINQKLTHSLGQEDTDLVLAAGWVVTRRALELPVEKRNRPVLGGAVEFSELMENVITSEGTSKIANYSFITNPQRVAADIDALKTLTKQRTIYAVIDRRLLYASGQIDEIKAEARVIESKYGVNIVMLPVGDTVDSILAAIPPSAKAIYISILPAVPPKEREKLFAALSKRGQVTLSMVGLPDVRLGAMAGLAPDNSAAIARRAALNAHQILLGIDTSVLPVYLPVEDRLIINRTSAEAAGWSADYETALIASFLNEGNRESGETITLEKAMKLAAEGNVDVLIQREQEKLSREELRQAESLQRPTVTLKLQQSFTDYTDRITPLFTPDRLHAGSYGLELRQSLFNDTIRSSIGSAVENVASEKLNTRSHQLDAIEEAGMAYLNYLTARALWNIQKENLRLTENNLQLARLRVNIGAAETSETFRWEQDASASRAAVFQAKADRDNARIEMNRILGQPRDKNWQFADVEVADDETYFMNNVLTRYILLEKDALRFGDFLRKVAVPASPELAAFDFGLSAAGIELRRIQRSFFLPEVSGVVSYSRTAQDTENIKFSSQGEMFGGVFLSLPIYEGGYRFAEQDRQKALIRQLAGQREKALQFIEQRALFAFNGMFSEHPNIRLSRRALVAAEKNYDSVREKYAQGAATILNLLDAQQALLNQRQRASIAVYSYLQQVVTMQRALAWFEHEKGGTEKQQWEKMLATYMKSNKLVVPMSAKSDPNSDYIKKKAENVVAESKLANVPGTPSVKATPAKIQAQPVPVQDETARPGLLKKILNQNKKP